MASRRFRTHGPADRNRANTSSKPASCPPAFTFRSDASPPTPGRAYDSGATAVTPLASDWRACDAIRETTGVPVSEGDFDAVEFRGTVAERRTAIDEAFGAMAEVDRLMSNYRDDSELSRINRDAAHDNVAVSDPMFSVLDAAQRISERSSGAFDVTVGPLVRLWGFHDRKPHEPTNAELAGVRPLVGYRNLLIDRERHTVHFARSGVEIDLGGIAKGFAVELAANALRRHGLQGFIDAGGNQYLLGLPPGKRAWNAGIVNPEPPGSCLESRETMGTSVSTSAGSANFRQSMVIRRTHSGSPHADAVDSGVERDDPVAGRDAGRCDVQGGVRARTGSWSGAGRIDARHVRGNRVPKIRRKRRDGDVAGSGLALSSGAALTGSPGPEFRVDDLSSHRISRRRPCVASASSGRSHGKWSPSMADGFVALALF